jgi:hypothetical protein
MRGTLRGSHEGYQKGSAQTWHNVPPDGPLFLDVTMAQANRSLGIVGMSAILS